MNVKVEAGSMTVAPVTVMNQPIVHTQLNIVPDKAYLSIKWTCLSFAPISVNGHSISAIAPDFVEVNETTSAWA